MEHELIRYISKYKNLSDELKNVIIESSIIRYCKKDEVILKDHHHAKESYMVLKGCIRNYLMIDGEEKTLDFFTEEQLIATPNYGKGIPSGQFLACVEDSILAVNTPEHEAEMFEKYPNFDAVCRIISEILVSKMQVDHTDYKLMTTEERYLNFIENRPELVNKVPQYQIASYLGLTPESLSRLRKRLMKKVA